MGAAQRVDDEVDLLARHDERRRQHVEMADGAHQKPLRLAGVGDALGDVAAIRQLLARCLVLHIFDAHHQPAPAHVADDGQVTQFAKPLFEIVAHARGVSAEVLAFDDLDVLERHRRRDRPR